MTISQLSHQSVRCARHATRALLLLSALNACSSAVGARKSGRAVSGATTSATGCNAATPSSARLGRAAVTFSGASSGEATVRLEGEAYKSTVLVDIATGTVLELVEGTYQLRISVNGYRAVDRSIAVVCGKESSVVVPLARR